MSLARSPVIMCRCCVRFGAGRGGAPERSCARALRISRLARILSVLLSFTSTATFLLSLFIFGFYFVFGGQGGWRRRGGGYVHVGIGAGRMLEEHGEGCCRRTVTPPGPFPLPPPSLPPSLPPLNLARPPMGKLLQSSRNRVCVFKYACRLLSCARAVGRQDRSVMGAGGTRRLWAGGHKNPVLLRGALPRGRPPGKVKVRPVAKSVGHRNANKDISV